MTGFFTKGLFRIPGEMLNFRSCLARKVKIFMRCKKTYLQCTIDTISVSIYETVMKNFGVESSLRFGGHFCLCPESDITYLRMQGETVSTASSSESIRLECEI